MARTGAARAPRPAAWRWAGALAAGVLVLVLSGCGAAAGTSHGRRAPARPVARTPTVAVIRTARVDVDGVVRTVFTDGAGRTLYWFTYDRPTRIACTVGCTQAWFPLLTAGDAIALRTEDLVGSFSVFAGPNGRQVEYRGHPLYTTDQDTGPRQATGQGFEDAWYVATPGLPGGGW